jgi:hypothetical protein
MRQRRVRYVFACFVVLGVLSNSATAQVNPQKLEAIEARLEHVQALAEKIPSGELEKFSVGAQNLFHLAKSWKNLKKHLQKPIPYGQLRAQFEDAVRTPLRPGGHGNATAVPGVPDAPVSSPFLDFLFSLSTGFVQSETSTAWCGNSVAVGFNDSGSFFESLFLGPGGLSFSGVSHSSTSGSFFFDMGFVNPGPNFSSELLGDPVLACANSSMFYYAQLFATVNASSMPVTAVALSTSVDGGATWNDPVAAVSKSASTHFLDKDYMAIDPASPNRIYVTYTDFDFSFAVCPNSARYAIEIVFSADGGLTWSSPVVVKQVCGSDPNSPFVQGSQVAVGPAGEVYVAWELQASTFFGGGGREIDIAKSTNHAATFSAAVKVSDVTEVGSGFTFQGGFRSNEFPMLAVDRSGTATNGNLYITWNDGRKLQVFDDDSQNGLYDYSAILASRSTDGGATWSAPVQVNNNPNVLPGGRGTDQFMPSVAVDKTGRVAECWYDRRLDQVNFRVDRFCGVSINAGASFSNFRVTVASWSPSLANDLFINPSYMGDYDSLTSDTTGSSPGFMGAYQVFTPSGGIGTLGSAFVPNPDVFSNFIP